MNINKQSNFDENHNEMQKFYGSLINNTDKRFNILKLNQKANS